MNSAKKYFEEGNKFYDEQNYEQALKCFQKAIGLNHGYAEAYKGLGYVYFDLQDYDKAIEYNRKAIELKPDYEDPYFNTGLAYFNKQDYDNAINYFQKMIELDPNDVETYLYLGNAYTQKNDDDKALEYFLRAIELNPDDAYINYIIGLAYGNKQDYDTAVNYLQKASELNPNHADSHFYLGIAYQKTHNFFEAIGCFQKVVDLNPNDADAYFLLGVNYVLEKNDYNNAINCYQKAIELNPYHADAYFQLGNAYAVKYDDKDDKAFMFFQKALELNPDFADVYLNMGMAYGRKGDYDQAIEYLQKAIELNPVSNNPAYASAYNTVGIMYTDKQDYDKALMYFKKAIELKHDFEEAYNNIAGLFFTKHDYDNAIKYLHKATELNPNPVYAVYYNNIGLTFDNRHDYDKAIECYNKAIELTHTTAYKDTDIFINNKYYKQEDVQIKFQWFTVNDYDKYLKENESGEQKVTEYENECNFAEGLLSNIGNAYRKNHDYDKAIEYLQKAIALNPDFSTAYYNMGLTYGQKKDHDKAIECFQLAIEKKHIEPSEVYHEMGVAYHHKQDYHKAIKSYQKAIDLKPDYANAYYNMGLAFGQADDHDKAIECFQEALELNYPDPAGIFYHMGLLYTEKQDYDKAIESLQKTLKLNHDFAFIYFEMGNVYNKKQDFDKAIKYYLKSANYFLKEKQIPTFEREECAEKAYNNIGYIYEKRGDLKKACKYYRISGKEDILEMLVNFDKDNRKKVIEQNILNDLLNNDNHFKTTVANVKNVKKYKIAYILSIYIISLLYIDDKKEKEVAHYREKSVVEKMLFRGKGINEVSKFRLCTVSNTDSNDDTEGKVLIGYLFEAETIVDNNTNNQYQAFAACFTFNHDSLNQFRFYGKENDKECTGVSVVFNDSFFEESAKLATSQQKQAVFRDVTEIVSETNPELLKSLEHLKTPEKPYVQMIGKFESIDKHALFRCIYFDPKANKVVSVGCKEDFLFYREGNSGEGEEYNKKMEKLIVDVSDELSQLKKQIEGLDKNIVAQLLINLRYLTKHVAYKDERECRIVKIADVNDTAKVKICENKSKKQKYLEYMEIGQHIKEIYFGPKATGMEDFQKGLLKEGLKIECKKSENPFV